MADPDEERADDDTSEAGTEEPTFIDPDGDGDEEPYEASPPG